MANLQHSSALISLFLLSTAHLCYPDLQLIDVHDLLPQFGLPKGILPKDIKSYSLSNDSFIVELSSCPCYINFGGRLVYYDNVIAGKLGIGKVSDVSGIQAKQFFLWVSVTGIDVEKDMLRFYVGPLSQTLPAGDFEDVRSCKNTAAQAQNSNSLMEALF